jgi:hypothetical protein
MSGYFLGVRASKEVAADSERRGWLRLVVRARLRLAAIRRS